MAEQRERVAPSGNHAGHAGMRMAKHDEHRYMSNATEALAELMRLGWVHKAPLPTARSAAPLYKSRTFALTEQGNTWVDLLSDSSQEAYDVLLRELWRTHPQLGSFPSTCVGADARCSDGELARGSPGQSRGGRRAERTCAFSRPGRSTRLNREPLVGRLRSRRSTAQSVGTSTPGSRQPSVGERSILTRAAETSSAPPRKRSCHSHSGLRVPGWTTSGSRSSAAGLKTLGVANFSYHVPAAPAIRVWGTAELDLDHDGRTRLHRRPSPRARQGSSTSSSRGVSASPASNGRQLVGPGLEGARDGLPAVA